MPSPLSHLARRILCAARPSALLAGGRTLGGVRRLLASAAVLRAKPAATTAFVCGDCGHDALKWSGCCPGCGAWNTLVAFKPAAAGGGAAGRAGDTRNVRPASFAAFAAPAAASSPPAAAHDGARPAAAPAAASGGWLRAAAGAPATERFTRLRDVGASGSDGGGGAERRASTGSAELDRLLSGGLVAGSVTLACGAPGVGKSTLLLQLAALLARHHSQAQEGGGAPYARQFAGAGGGAAADARWLAARAEREAAAPAAARAVAYVSGEESATQIRSRARRLGIGGMELWLLNETCVDTVLEKLGAMEAERQLALAVAQLQQGGEAGPAPAAAPPPPLAAVIIDSIQTMWTSAFPASQAGSALQVRESCIRLLQFAKATGTPVILVGHVTKAGDIAGPRTLEHIVDTVVFMEHDDFAGSGGGGGGGGGGGSGAGDSLLLSAMPASPGAASSSSGFRLLRCLKNRFGSTSEIALLEMTGGGFVEADPASLFLSPVAAGDGDGSESGGAAAAGASSSCSCVTAAMGGSRALLVEVQALVSPSQAAFPRQRALSLPQERLALVLALLARFPRIRPRYADVLASAVGGLRLADTGSDLALAVALAGCFLRAPPAATRGALFVGELGLAGELRPVAAIEARLAAADALGFRRAYIPRGALPAAGSRRGDMRVTHAASLAEVLRAVFGEAATGPRAHARAHATAARGRDAAGTEAPAASTLGRRVRALPPRRGGGGGQPAGGAVERESF